MSRNVIETIKKIFEKLIDKVEEDDKERINSVERRLKVDSEYTAEATNIVKYSRVNLIDINENVKIFTADYEEDKYIVLPKKYLELLEVVDIKEVQNQSIKQGIGILAMSSNGILIKSEISSLEIINSCLGITAESPNKYVEFSYYEIADFFEEFLVAKSENNSFLIEVEEDIFRMFGIILTLNSENQVSEKLYEEIRSLLFLKSSRSIAVSIINIMQSEIKEHKYLQLYQCIEYLFIIYNAIEISNKYSIDSSTAIEMVINENFKTTEISNVSNTIRKYASESAVSNFYSNIIQSSEEQIDEVEKVSKYIYKVRCNIAHLKYKQDDFLKQINWKELMKYTTSVVLSIYQKMDDEIIDICKDNNSWIFFRKD